MTELNPPPDGLQSRGAGAVERSHGETTNGKGEME